MLTKTAWRVWREKNRFSNFHPLSEIFTKVIESGPMSFLHGLYELFLLLNQALFNENDLYKNSYGSMSSVTCVTFFPWRVWHHQTCIYLCLFWWMFLDLTFPLLFSCSTFYIYTISCSCLMPASIQAWSLHQLKKVSRDHIKIFMKNIHMLWNVVLYSHGGW